MALVPLVLRLIVRGHHRRTATDCRHWILVQKSTAVLVLQLHQLISSLEVLVAWLSFKAVPERSPALHPWSLVIILSLVAIAVVRMGVGFGKGGHGARYTLSVLKRLTQQTMHCLPRLKTYSVFVQSSLSPSIVFLLSLSLSWYVGSCIGALIGYSSICRSNGGWIDQSEKSSDVRCLDGCLLS